MRLINVHTGRLEEFHSAVPPYAIHSHTWGFDKEEISFEDIQSDETTKQGPGLRKLQGCCKQAIRDRLQYAWVDTCCIDKKNSTELHEAINSMFEWYRKAEEAFETKFRRSRWFERGWTLQELLAPRMLAFYDHHWNALGTKKELADQIQDITGIPTEYLVGRHRLQGASVAQRMSWAATRETKKAEDMAYSLMGIFDINMSMIYGEGGAKAFGRLLKEIMVRSADDSTLAWDLNTIPTDINGLTVSGDRHGGVHPVSPAAFRYSGAVVSSWSAPEPTVEGSGVLHGNLTIRVPPMTTSSGDTYGLLNCSISNRPETFIGIPLCRIPHGLSNAEFVRPAGSEAVAIPAPRRTLDHQSIRVFESQNLDDCRRMDRQYGFFIEMAPGLGILEVYPSDRWERERSYILSGNIGFRHRNIQRTWVRFRDTERSTKDFFIALNIENKETKSEARCHVLVASRDTTLRAIALESPGLTFNIFGKTMASNGFYRLTANVTEKQQGQQVYFVMKLKPSDKSPQSTINISAALESLRESSSSRCLGQDLLGLGVANSIGRAKGEVDNKGRRLRALQLQISELKEEERKLSDQLRIEKEDLKVLLGDNSEL
ncbi:hypothetical protein BDP81DRAFT_444989 [Colletotrichum phormii]|uniref:Heterokaryon incompatibility domain-containing protein n=1 Tax=Colletotrichum phormii TaxID=359342 RepID=A0AAJ0A4T0_9PEZI|nr:uncharacterized protein BDP81DRAFT_444989 [Colletotrichum phormii]KAK1656487.1 hypothetical protein BDP81DRAFT_444989 [Colletotrichum phormii]